MKVEVDWGLCESNGVCMGIIPEVFQLDDKDMLHILQLLPLLGIAAEHERRVADQLGHGFGAGAAQ